MKDLVIVRSKTINNESVPVTIDVIDPATGERDRREITRPVIFKDFKAEMPIKWARTLVSKNPNEFSFDRKEGQLADADKSKPKTDLVDSKAFKCDTCGAESKSNAGLSAHIRFNHPEIWANRKNVTN